jgi:hypothetical protein
MYFSLKINNFIINAAYAIWISLFHYLENVSECVPNLSIQIQALDLNDVQGALKLISNYYHE